MRGVLAPAAWVVFSAMALLSVACSSSPDGDGDGDGDDAGDGGGGQAAPGPGAQAGGGGSELGECDGQVDCMACQDCAYAPGGPCQADVDACLADDGCVEINDCIGACLTAAGEAAVFSVCYAECDANKNQGGDAYEAVLGCVRDDACSSSCEFE